MRAERTEPQDPPIRLLTGGRDSATGEGTGAEAMLRSIRRLDGLAARGSHPQRLFAEVLARFASHLDAPDAYLACCNGVACCDGVAGRDGASGRLQVRALRGSSDRLLLSDDALVDGIDGDRPTLAAQAARSGVPEYSDEPSASVAAQGSGPGLGHAAAIPLNRHGATVAVIVVANAARPIEPGSLEALGPLTSVCAGIVAGELERERNAELAARLDEERLATDALLANLPGMAFRAHDDDRRQLIFVGPGAAELFGVSREELLREDAAGLLDHVHAADRGDLLGELRWALLQRRPFESTYRLQSGGEARWVHERSRGVYDAEGGLRYVEGFLTDVTDQHRARTDRRRLEARLRRAQKVESLEVLVTGIARDFNNLMQGVLGNAHMLHERLPEDDADARDALARVEAAADRATDRARYLLAYTGQQERILEPQPAFDLIRRALPLLERELRPQVTFDVVFDAPEAHVLVDQGQIQRVLVEGMRNAVAAISPDEGHVRIRMRTESISGEALSECWHGARLAPGAYLVIDIEDDGCGMSDAVRQRAFDPFFTTGVEGDGRGLGLSFVLGTMRALGGAVHLSSTLGEGTCLRLILPPHLGEILEQYELTPAPSRTPASAPAPPPACVGETPAAPRILVVDDEKLVREVACRLLSRQGYEVESATDGLSGLERFRLDPSRFDVVLLDLTMPRMDGITALEQMRLLRPDLPALVSSGFADDRAIERLKCLPGVGFLRKPYRVAELTEKLESVRARADVSAS